MPFSFVSTVFQHLNVKWFFLRALLLQPNTASALTVLHPTTPQHLHLCLEPFSLLKYPRNPCCALLPCYFPSVHVVIPVKYIKFYFSSNSDPWEVKLALRWELLCSGNTADAKSSSKPGFPALFYTGRNLPPDQPSAAAGGHEQGQQCWEQLH